MSVTQFLKEKRLPTRTRGIFGGGRLRDRESDLNPSERKQYRDWLSQKQGSSQITQGSFTSAFFGGRGGTNVSSVNIPPPDLSFATFLKEKGYKDYVRTGLFRRKRAKTIARASDREKREYESWKASKQFEYNKKVQEAAENNVLGGSQSFNFDTANIQIKTTPSQRELNNKKLL